MQKFFEKMILINASRYVYLRYSATLSLVPLCMCRSKSPWTEIYSKPEKHLNSVNYFRKSSISDVWLGSEYVSAGKWKQTEITVAHHVAAPQRDAVLSDKVKLIVHHCLICSCYYVFKIGIFHTAFPQDRLKRFAVWCIY